MKILKPGKVEQRKFTCERCGCEFVVRRTEMMWTIYGLRKCCPTCDESHNWENGEPYEEPAQDDRERLDILICDLFNREPISRKCIVDYLIANGVTFREKRTKCKGLNAWRHSTWQPTTPQQSRK